MVYIVGMAKRGGSAHVATIKTKGKDGAVYTSHLLRRSYREGGKVRHENLGNLSHLPVEIIEVIRAMLAGRRWSISTMALRSRGRCRMATSPRCWACCAAWTWSGYSVVIAAGSGIWWSR